MTNKKIGSYLGEVSPPAPPINSPSLPYNYEPSHLIQLLVQVQKDVTIVSTKLDRTITDLEKLDKKSGELHDQFKSIKYSIYGALAVLAVAVPLVWWLIGGQITELKNRVMTLPTGTTTLQKTQ